MRGGPKGEGGAGDLDAGSDSGALASLAGASEKVPAVAFSAPQQWLSAEMLEAWRTCNCSALIKVLSSECRLGSAGAASRGNNLEKTEEEGPSALERPVGAACRRQPAAQ